MMNYLRQLTVASALSVAAFSTVGCDSKAGNGALIGGGLGTLAGGIIGHQSGHTGAGMLIGGAVGAGGGYIVGNEMDKSDAKKERERRYDEDRYYNDAPPPRAGYYSESRSSYRDSSGRYRESYQSSSGYSR